MTKKTDKLVEPGKVWCIKHYTKNGPEISEEQTLEVRRFEVEIAYVKASFGVTINMGNYESARCDVGVALPTYVEEIPAAFEEAWRIAQAELEKQCDEIRKGK
jgi:hypothetical protein